MKKLIIELSDERLITPSGLSLVGQLLGKSRFIKKCNTMKVDSKRSQSQIKNGDILLSYIGLLCQGKTLTRISAKCRQILITMNLHLESQDLFHLLKHCVRENG